MSPTPKGKSLSFWLQSKRRTFRRRNRSSDSAPLPLHGVLQSIDPAAFSDQRTRCPITIAEWQEAVGIRIADRSSPRQIDRDGTLLIAVASSVWAQELSLLSASVCERLRSQGHDVRTVRFVVCAVEPARRAPEQYVPRFVPAPKPLPKDILLELERIEDQQLRATMATAIAASLAASSRY